MTLARALAARNDKDRLQALLEAWRACKHPRIADLIDRVSAPLVSAAGKITAKSVPQRVEALIAAAKSGDAVALGRVLISEWAGTWDKALPVLQAVIAAPHDPRVAAHFAKQIDETRFDTWKSAGYWRPLFARLSDLDDVRQLPLMEAQLSRAKNRFYAENMRELEEDLVRGLKRVRVPTLSAADEAALAQLEAPFATAAATERHAGKSGEQLLEAVYAAPTDLSQRLVYGDWLAQQGDPRGEYIALQNQPSTEKSKKRLAALEKKHWKAWVGPLADWLRGPSRRSDGPAFRLGFLQAAYIEAPNYRQPKVLEQLLERPEWRTLEHVQWWNSGGGLSLERALTHPNLGQVRRVAGLDYVQCKAFFKKPPPGAPPINDVKLPSTNERLAIENLKSLEVLRINTDQLEFVDHALDGLQRLVIEDATHGLSAEVWRRVKATKLPALTVDGYRAMITVRREPGEKDFTTLEFDTLWGLDCVDDLLRHVPRSIRRLAAPVPVDRLGAAELKTLRTLLRAFKDLDPATLP